MQITTKYEAKRGAATQKYVPSVDRFLRVALVGNVVHNMVFAGRCRIDAIAAPAVNVPVSPEGVRGLSGQDLPAGSEGVPEFTQEAYDNFMQGYQSQYQEISMWVDESDIEGNDNHWK